MADTTPHSNDASRSRWSELLPHFPPQFVDFVFRNAHVPMRPPSGEQGTLSTDFKHLDECYNLLPSSAASQSNGPTWSTLDQPTHVTDPLKEAVILPLKFPSYFTDHRRPWRGILLFGEDGCEKEYLVEVVAYECEAILMRLDMVHIVEAHRKFNKIESELYIKCFFELSNVLQKQHKKPAILHFKKAEELFGGSSEVARHLAGDETNCSVAARVPSEELVTSGRRFVSELLVQFHRTGSEYKEMVLLCTSSAPWHIDPVIRKRLERRVHVPLPGPAQRRCILKQSLEFLLPPTKRVPLGGQEHSAHNLSDADLDVLSMDEHTEGSTRKELMHVVRRAWMCSANEFLEVRKASDKDDVSLAAHTQPLCTLKHCLAAAHASQPFASQLCPSISQQMEQWKNDFT